MSSLDLRDAALRRTDPGQCLHGYFQLRNSRHSNIDEMIKPLKVWLENHLEIIAKGPDHRDLQRIAVKLDWKNINQYCENLIEDFRNNQCRNHRRPVELIFQFKPLNAVA